MSQSLSPQGHTGVECERGYEGAPQENPMTEDIKTFYKLNKVGEREAKRFRTREMRFNLEFTKHDIYTLLRMTEIFEDILENLFGNTKLNDKIGFKLRHKKLEKPIYVPLIYRQDLTAERIMERIENDLESNEGIDITEPILLIFVHVDNPE